MTLSLSKGGQPVCQILDSFAEIVFRQPETDVPEGSPNRVGRILITIAFHHSHRTFYEPD
jgi:hypothetical protein